MLYVVLQIPRDQVSIYKRLVNIIILGLHDVYNLIEGISSWTESKIAINP